MLNKPIKFRKIVMMSMAIIFWLSGISLFAQNKQTDKSEPEKKQVPNAQPKVTLSNKQTNAPQKDEAALKQKQKDEKAVQSKNEKITKKQVVPVKHSSNVQTTSSKAPTAATTKTNNDNSTVESAKSQALQKDWEIKKAKMIAAMKAKGVPQEDIDKKIASLEKKMNLNNNTIK
jgi:hypothetical protein